MNLLFVPAFLSGIGPWEVVAILGLALMFFGAKKLPELARGLGKSVREFKDATQDVRSQIERSINEDPKPADKTQSNTNEIKN